MKERDMPKDKRLTINMINQWMNRPATVPVDLDAMVEAGSWQEYVILKASPECDCIGCYDDWRAAEDEGA
jgi:hypothetical protein